MPYFQFWPILRQDAAVSEISGSASLAIGADLWTDGPKTVIPGKVARIEYTGVYRRPWYPVGTVFTYTTPVTVEASGAIEGASALAITGTATLAGAGALAASVPLTFGGTSALTGSGALAGAGDLTLATGTVTLAGAGALATGAPLTFATGTVTLTGSGALATSTPLVFGTGTVTLTGEGALSGSAVLTLDASGSTVQGAMLGSADLVFGGTSLLEGAGALSGASALTVGGTAALSGSGALDGSAALTLGVTGDATALSGDTAGDAVLVFDASGVLVTLIPADSFEITGGYLAEARRQRRKKRRADDESKPPVAPPSDAAQAGPGPSDATPEAPAADLELVRQLVAYWTGEADRDLLNRRAQRALDYALRAQTVLAMQLFERELARQIEDDDITAVLMLLADD